MEPGAVAALLKDLTDRTLQSEFEPVNFLEAPEVAEILRSLQPAEPGGRLGLPCRREGAPSCLLQQAMRDHPEQPDLCGHLMNATTRPGHASGG